MVEEDAERYKKRMDTLHNHMERRAMSDFHGRKKGVENRLREIEEMRHRTEKEYKARKYRQGKAAAVSAGTGASASSCDATYSTVHDGANGAVDLFGFAALLLGAALAICARRQSRPIRFKRKGEGWMERH